MKKKSLLTLIIIFTVLLGTVHCFSQSGQHSLDSFINAPASLEAQFAPKTFNWEATHAERFLNSPCYHRLGFDPFANPEEQEKKYQICEHELQIEQAKNVGIVVVIAILIITLIVLLIKRLTKKRVILVIIACLLYNIPSYCQTYIPGVSANNLQNVGYKPDFDFLQKQLDISNKQYQEHLNNETVRRNDVSVNEPVRAYQCDSMKSVLRDKNTGQMNILRKEDHRMTVIFYANTLMLTDKEKSFTRNYPLFTKTTNIINSAEEVYTEIFSSVDKDGEKCTIYFMRGLNTGQMTLTVSYNNPNTAFIYYIIDHPKNR